MASTLDCQCKEKRKWFQLRYALIPYLVEQGERSLTTGPPVLRALIFHHEDDPTCWDVDDAHYLGDSYRGGSGSVPGAVIGL